VAKNKILGVQANMEAGVKLWGVRMGSLGVFNFLHMEHVSDEIKEGQRDFWNGVILFIGVANSKPNLGEKAFAEEKLF